MDRLRCDAKWTVHAPMWDVKVLDIQFRIKSLLQRFCEECKLSLQSGPLYAQMLSACMCADLGRKNWSVENWDGPLFILCVGEGMVARSCIIYPFWVKKTNTHTMCYVRWPWFWAAEERVHMLKWPAGAEKATFPTSRRSAQPRETR